jgi:hypothetical protein
LLVTIAFSKRKIVIYSTTSLNRYSGITRGFTAFFYAIVTENVAEVAIEKKKGILAVETNKFKR